MKIKIAVPDNPVYDFFIQNKDSSNNKFDFEGVPNFG